VQRPFHPEGPVCHVYLIHPPGGIVGGDRLALDVDVGPGAHALLTTPGATRFYRAGPAGRAVLEQHLDVRGGLLEWLPQETIFFTGAQAAATTRVRLHGDARFLGWEIACYGRTAGDLPFTGGHAHQRFEVWRDGEPLLIDSQRLDGAGPAGAASWGLQGHPVMGTLLAFPATAAELEAARAALGPDAPPAAATLLDGVLLCRALGAQAQSVRSRFAAVWRALRPGLCGRPACPPRIWAT
jgi:urease accessory protein